MSTSAQFLNPAEAARQLGVSAKALRLYEQRGLISPVRSRAGWRTYGPDEMVRAKEIVALRALGFSLVQVARVLAGDVLGLEPALVAHQASIEARIHQLVGTVAKVRQLRAELALGKMPPSGELVRVLQTPISPNIAFDLPWPWGGERFELRNIESLNYIIGPLGCGKTRLAQRLAEVLPGAAFIGLERLANGGAAAQAQLDSDAALRSRVELALAWLVDEGASVSPALVALLAGLEVEGPSIFIVDMLEQGLDQPTQEALIVYLRCRSCEARPLFVLTRSCAILDLTAVGPSEAIILCPANHSPPSYVAPFPGAPGYEAVATCLASPEVRARTEGVIAWRPTMQSVGGLR